MHSSRHTCVQNLITGRSTPTSCLLVGHRPLKTKSTLQRSHPFLNALIANLSRFLTKLIANASCLHWSSACIFKAERNKQYNITANIDKLENNFRISLVQQTAWHLSLANLSRFLNKLIANTSHLHRNIACVFKAERNKQYNITADIEKLENSFRVSLVQQTAWQYH